MKTTLKIDLPSVIGKGYGEFWRYKGLYRVVKGSRASKKSKTTALWFIYHLMKLPDSNLLVVRNVFRTLKDSCFSDLQWACTRLGVKHLWNFTVSPLEAIYIPTGQRIYFRGLDDPLKITSISVPYGFLNFMWLEEAYEIPREDAFDMLDESIRGKLPEHLFKQVTITFNPWNERHWLKKRFFDVDDKDVLALTTNYTCNEWLSESDKKLFSKMKERNPRRYRVAGLGEWGITDGLVYDNWEVRDFDIQELLQDKSLIVFHGLDFGYTNDPSAFITGAIDKGKKVIYLFDEFSETKQSNAMLAEMIMKKGYGKDKIVADSAEPKSIDELRQLGLNRIKGSRKGKDSVRFGINTIQDYKIYVHSRCKKTIAELSSYVFAKDKSGKLLNDTPKDSDNHLMDAFRYAVMDTVSKNRISFS